MQKKQVLAIAGGLALVSAVAAAVVVVLRRSRQEPPPISATVPRIDELPTTITAGPEAG
ncbi:hypothetical protein ND991_13940 [Gordonia sputi]|uniref:PVV-CTERM domain-containing choice-of-anchor G protein n=1 Tax=Gordonia sputi TaxID=36823 RepID=UPI0020438671|nr:hypothetical protein [Gordonia sputi]MCM3896313.1 hypothetical protein [Gordonia sputi]